MGKKWLKTDEKAALKKLVQCSKTTDLRQLGVSQYMVRRNWEHCPTYLVGEGEILLRLLGASRLMQLIQ